MHECLGIGVDIVKVERVEKLSPSACERLFTSKEREYCEKSPLLRAERFSARFAAKEAVLKALGTGLSAGIRWHDIEVIRTDSGAPSIQLYGKALEYAQSKGVTQVLISLSHDGGIAIAMVTLVGSLPLIPER